MELYIKDVVDILHNLESFDFSQYDTSIVHGLVLKRMEAAKCNTIDEFSSKLSLDKNERIQFINAFNNGHTEFFRNPISYSVLEQLLIPSLLLKHSKSNRNEIRIWSAACSSGPEVYSLAIILEELKRTHNSDFNYRIIATDKNQQLLNEAKTGVYDSSTIEKVNLKRFNKWFSKSDKKFKIDESLKSNVDFTPFDLFNTELSFPSVSIFGDFDLIFCANVLFYYKPEFQSIIINKLKKGLSKGGYIITGEAERTIFLNNNFKEEFPHSAIFKI